MMAPVDKFEAPSSAAAVPGAQKHSQTSASEREIAPHSSPAMMLTYHEVWPKASSYLYSVTTVQFEEHLQLIRAIGMSGSSEAALPRVTFDDGHVSTHQHALGLLEKYSLRGIFFVTAGFVETQKEVMNWAQLREVVSLGHEVQAHGWSHAHLTQCSDSELANELERSKQTLEDRLGVAVTALSFPGGRWNTRVLEACARAGYRRVYASEPWLKSAGSGLELQGRLMVRRSTDVRLLEQLFRGNRAAMLRLRARSAFGVTSRLILGDRGYLRLWRKLARKQEGQNGQASVE